MAWVGESLAVRERRFHTEPKEKPRLGAGLGEACPSRATPEDLRPSRRALQAVLPGAVRGARRWLPLPCG